MGIQIIFFFSKKKINSNRFRMILRKVYFSRAFILNSEKCPNLSKHSKKILLATKPAPLLESVYKSKHFFFLSQISREYPFFTLR
jgi:hypothetical protein